MAVATGAASCLNDALDLTPSQIAGLASALSRLHGGDEPAAVPGTPPPGQRYGTLDEFKAALFGALGR